MKKKLSEVCKFQYGYPFDSSLFSDIDGTPVIRIRDIIRGFSETKTTEACSTDYIVDNGDILIGMDGEFNIAKWKGGKAFLNQRVCKLIPFDVDKDYIFYHLPKILKNIEEKTSFATVKHLSAKQLNCIYIDIPEQTIQYKIANIFIKIDSLINKRKQQLFKLDQLVKSRFVEMFGDENSFHSWVTCKVDNIAEVCVGIVIKPSQYYTLDIESGIKAFRSLNIGEMYIKNKDWVYFTKEGHQKNQKSIIKENDVLIVRSGSPGTACVATKEYAGYNAIDIIIAHPNCKKINPVFLAMFTNMPHGMNQIRENTGGAAQQHFNVGGYKNITIILPPLFLQEQFAAFVQQVEKAKSSVNLSLEKLETLKKSLMQEYFG